MKPRLKDDGLPPNEPIQRLGQSADAGGSSLISTSPVLVPLP
ncbi:MAG: hypothetical protein ACRENH_06200 [Gemmatimonadaceae bacterium]